MKVLVIICSSRKGKTYRAAERIREILRKKVPVEWGYVMLKDNYMEDRRGCYVCFEREKNVAPSPSPFRHTPDLFPK